MWYETEKRLDDSCHPIRFCFYFMLENVEKDNLAKGTGLTIRIQKKMQFTCYILLCHKTYCKRIDISALTIKRVEVKNEFLEIICIL